MARRFHKRMPVLAGLLSLLLTVTVCAAAITAVVSQSTTLLAQGVQYQYEDVETGDGPQKIHTVSFSLAEELVGMRAALPNGHVKGTQKVIDMARAADEDGTVIAAINGGYFSGSTVHGLMITDGELYNSPPVTNSPLNPWEAVALAVDKNNQPFMDDTPAFSATYTIGEETVAFQHINRVRAAGNADNLVDSFVLYTDWYAASTGTDNTGGLEVSLQVEDDTIRHGTSMTGKVVAINPEGNSPLEPGVVVLSATALAKAPLEKLKLGDTVQLDFAFEDARWADVTFAIGGGRILVKDGEIQQLPDNSLHNNRNPRTAVGIKPDGTVVWMTVDGRQSGVSAGVRATTLAQLLIDKGCTWVINLDGGGSTTMAVKMPGEELAVRNVPSNAGAEERRVANGILLVLKDKEAALPTTTTTTTVPTTTTTTAAPTTTTVPPTVTTTTAPTTTTTTTTVPPATTTTVSPSTTQAATTVVEPTVTGVQGQPITEDSPAVRWWSGVVLGAAALLIAGGIFLLLWKRGTLPGP